MTGEVIPSLKGCLTSPAVPWLSTVVRNYGDVSGVTGVAARRREGCRPLSRQMMTTEVITLVVRRVRPLVDGRGRTLIATGVIDSTADIVREKGRHPSPNQRHRNYERQY